ncbi:hypothetical protein EUX98_g1605 [Antrodiella citrinella]|uniref:Uncharacterized protein n=1 Tax=Antrodiella citrinella TaxID=2447956 RepID=A0A4V3XJC4_9APHY|nr:hypothetical protein EUX98_g1605 [Antrodiella citrinella]
MCEQCRGRHRIYANTKRQKRKLEKLALGGQHGPVVWMPPNEDHVDLRGEDVEMSPEGPPPEEPPAPPAPIPNPGPPAQILAQPQQYNLPPPTWDNSAIDPRLFSQTSASSSELAGALNFPGLNPTSPQQLARMAHVAPPQMQVTIIQHQPLPPVPTPEAILSEPSQHSELAYPPPEEPQQPEPEHDDVPLFGANVASHVEISARAISEAAAQMSDPNLPHRFCSIKGCKSVIAGDSFFKMCNPCRDRYRNYGTTKRAKWRKEKELAVAELQNLRIEEDKRRADNGLPPLAREEIEWQDISADTLGSAAHASKSPFAHVVPVHAPRMCTVSHCREILPAEYEYLRCERHRIQNRHHSKLKRVRDKEVKAVAFDDWAAAVGAMSQKHEDEEDFVAEEEDEDDAVEEEGSETTDGGLLGTGIPPAARGSRRINHVCSIKVCHNLLSPSNPWKMCDECRSRDRTARKIKALRESGVAVEPLPPRRRTPPLTKGEKKARKKKKKEIKKADSVADQPEAGPSGIAPMVEDIQQPVTIPQTEGAMPFMTPLLPLQEPQHSTMASALETPAAGDSDTPNANDTPGDDKPTRKKKPRKKKETAPEAPTMGEPATVSVSQVPGGHLAPSVGPPLQPPYHVPYYMPPPFALPPYGPARMGAPPAMYARDPYAPNPMYHPSYPYAYPYPPPPPGYAYPPPPFAMVPPPPPPTAAPSPQVSASGSQVQTPHLQATPPVQPQSASPAPASTPALAAAPAPAPSSVPVPMPPPMPHPAPIQAQTMFNPFAQPHDIASMYSTWSSRPKGDKPGGTHSNRTPYGSEVTATVGPQPAGTPAPGDASLKLTFNAKTGQTYMRPEPIPGLGVIKRKRSVVRNEEQEQGWSSPKRVGVGEGGQGGPVSMLVDQQPAPVVESASRPCGNKTCHRVIPPHASGNICDKCKEKVRKKQAKVKQRFKLEPKKNNIAIRAGPVGDSTSDIT